MSGLYRDFARIVEKKGKGSCYLGFRGGVGCVGGDCETRIRPISIYFPLPMFKALPEPLKHMK